MRACAVAPAVAAVMAAATGLVGCSPTTPGRSVANNPAGVPPSAQRLEIVRHVDGDTVHVELREDGPAGDRGEELTVRLLEIDSPEVARDGHRAECFAEEASGRTERLLPLGKAAYGVPDRELLDQYDRTLLYLWTSDGEQTTFVNEALVAGGFARSVLYPPNDRYHAAMRSAQARARSAGRGLWDAC